MKTNKPKLFKPNIPKKIINLSWPQAKARFPHMKPYGDADKDGLKNFRDCKPFDMTKKGEEHEDEECSDCGKKFEKGDLIIPRFDKPKLKMHMEKWKCKNGTDKV